VTTESTPTTRQCPFCAETIQAAAIVCRYCGRDLVEQPAAPVVPPAAPAAPTGPHLVKRNTFTSCSACRKFLPPSATRCTHCGVVFTAPMEIVADSPPPHATLRGPALIVVCVAVALFLLVVFLFGSQSNSAAPPATAQLVTIDGSDSAGGATIDPVNVFDRPSLGRTVGTVRSGARVALLSRDGNAVLIRAADGVQGYVSVDFIKELR